MASGLQDGPYLQIGTACGAARSSGPGRGRAVDLQLQVKTRRFEQSKLSVWIIPNMSFRFSSTPAHRLCSPLARHFSRPTPTPFFFYFLLHGRCAKPITHDVPTAPNQDPVMCSLDDINTTSATNFDLFVCFKHERLVFLQHYLLHTGRTPVFLRHGGVLCPTTQLSCFLNGTSV
jgi:hypothetical protein